MNAANRLALNTIVVYGRRLITMGITLCSSRLVLNAVYSMNYGIFNFMASTILCCLLFHLEKNLNMQKKVFIDGQINMDNYLELVFGTGAYKAVSRLIKGNLSDGFRLLS